MRIVPEPDRADWELQLLGLATRCLPVHAQLLDEACCSPFESTRQRSSRLGGRPTNGSRFSNGYPFSADARLGHGAAAKKRKAPEPRPGAGWSRWTINYGELPTLSIAKKKG